MTILADESVDFAVVKALREAGHTIVYVAELAAGISDERVLAMAVQERCLLLTADKDFGELVFSRRMSHSGVVLVRLPDLSPSQRAELIRNTIDRHGQNLVGRFTVLTERLLRIQSTRR